MTFLSTNLVITEKLEKLGLNKKEAQIYLAALESGETNIEGLSKKSKIKRTTVYDIVESLKEKGLLSSTFSKKKKYMRSTKNLSNFFITHRAKILKIFNI